MNHQRKLLVDRLEASGKEFASYVSELADEDLHVTPAPNEWTVHQVIAHMRDVEQFAFLVRVQRIMKEEHPAVANFDQDEWWKQDHYAANEPLKKIIADFRSSRRKMVTLLRKASEKDWKNWAVHSAYGKISLEWVAMHCYHHTLEHIAQIGYVREKMILKELGK